MSNEDLEYLNSVNKKSIRAFQEEQKRLWLDKQLSKLPLRYRRSRLEDFSTDSKAQENVLNIVIQYISSFLENSQQGANLIFMGRPGTGKTMLSCILSRILIENGKHVLYTTTTRMMDQVKGTYVGVAGKNENQILEQCVAPDLLVIDEISSGYGKQGGLSSAEKRFLFEVINHRYEQLKGTLVISNLDTKALEEAVGERSLDRLSQNSPFLAFDWESFRQGRDV